MDADTMLAGIRRWVEIESHTPDHEGMAAIMALVEGSYAGAGARTERIAGRDGFGDHIVARSPWGSGKGVLVLSHLDTVHPRGTLLHQPFRVEGDVAYGPGIYDMKGGAYLAFQALGDLIREDRKTPLPIVHLFTSDEEVGSPTSRDLIESLAREARYVLVTEPGRDGGKVVTSRKGTGRYVMRLTGRPSHSGTSHEDGRSAVLELAHQILALEGMTDYAAGVTVNVGIVAGGTGVNVVPAAAMAEIDFRVPTDEAARVMVDRIEALTPRVPDVRIELVGGMNRPPYERNAGTVALYARAERLAGELGFALGEVPMTGGGSDGNFTASFVPTLDGLGVLGKGAHTDHEQLYVSSLVPRMRLMRRLFETLD
ncbi:M20 family metallopeptidase [Marinivivus vitaminiproducens]|uniref:M20 family metallopeptidase n=1 Tax=Marinivivus vitaminiproducens TaxID=3035935 RepID=UPI0027A196FE|nr:M20 family metallopeptidase [Geminicoccaceae bacterium SCSIO 64248]